MSQYIQEAFTKLSLLDEEDFNLRDDSDIEDMKSFMDNQEDIEDVEDIIDPEADSEEELEDSYIGKVILECPVCHSKIYKNAEDVHYDEETDLANEEEECPFCYSMDGFTIVGQVAPYEETEVTVDVEPKDEEDSIEIKTTGKKGMKAADAAMDAFDDEEKNESFKSRKNRKLNESKKRKKSLKEDFDTNALKNYAKNCVELVTEYCEKNAYSDSQVARGLRLFSEYVKDEVSNRRINNESLKEGWGSETFQKEPIIEFPNGEYFYVVKDDDKNTIYAGGATNTGVFREFEIDYDDDDTLDGNLERLYDYIIKQRPELLDESLKEGRSSSSDKLPNWRGVEGIKYLSPGNTQSDPSLVYNGYTFNYWDIEDALWDMFLEDTGHTDSESDVPEVEDEFNQWLKGTATYYLNDVIYGGYFQGNSKDWRDRYRNESLKSRKKSKNLKESLKRKFNKSLKEAVKKNNGKKPLKESYSDVFQDLVWRAESFMDDSYTKDDAIMRAIDDGLIYTRDIIDVAYHYGAINDSELLNNCFEDLYSDLYSAVRDEDEDEEEEVDESLTKNKSRRNVKEAKSLSRIRQDIEDVSYDLPDADLEANIDLVNALETPEIKQDIKKAYDFKSGKKKSKKSEKLKESYSIVDLSNGDRFGNYSSVEQAKSKAIYYAKNFRSSVAVIDDNYKPVCGYNTLGKEIPVNESLKEAIENVDVETEHDKIHISSEEKTPSGEEVIAPIDPAQEADILADEEEPSEEPLEEPMEDEAEFEMDEFEEEPFNTMGESYLKKVYENVNSFKTTKVRTQGNTVFVEGVINFKSGKNKATTFKFEAKDCIKNKVRFIGENLQFSRGKKSFSLRGTMNGNKFLPESLNYNYRVNGNRVYGTEKIKPSKPIKESLKKTRKKSKKK